MSSSWGSWDSSSKPTQVGSNNEGWGNSVQVPIDGSPKSLPVLPLLIMVLTLAISLVLIFVSGDKLLLSLLGYLLTPFGSFGVFAWASGLDANLRMDVWYDRQLGKLIALRALAIISLGIGFIHMWDVATVIARFYAGGLA